MEPVISPISEGSIDMFTVTRIETSIQSLDLVDSLRRILARQVAVDVDPELARSVLVRLGDVERLDGRVAVVTHVEHLERAALAALLTVDPEEVPVVLAEDGAVIEGLRVAAPHAQVLGALV